MRTTTAVADSLALVLLLALGPWLVAGAEAQPIGTVRVADGLNLPTFVIAPPDDFARLFILEERTGNVLIMDLVTGAVDPTPFLTVPDVANEGLQGLAFHPLYEFNGHLYVYYQADLPLRSVVERYTRSAVDPGLADPASAQTVIEIAQPATNHNGGWIGFGPDGYLYLPMGDGGGGCDPDDNGQNTGTLLGSLMRLDVDRDDFPADADRNYAIPPDNPFVGQAGLDEIWSYGLRNPFRSSFDRLTGDLYMADVGQRDREEINFQPAASTGGENWGWDLREGFIATPDVGACAGGELPGRADPIYDYQHLPDQSFSVTGGYVYRGPDGPAGELTGRYFFGDFINRWIHSIDAETGFNFTDWTAQFVPPEGTIDQIVSFGEDGAGYLYIVDRLGEVFRVVGPFDFVPCPDLELSMDAIMGTQIFEHCRNIRVGPAYQVGPGGDLTLRAGNLVWLGNGTSVAADGELTIEIDASLQLTPPD